MASKDISADQLKCFKDMNLGAKCQQNVSICFLLIQSLFAPVFRLLFLFVCHSCQRVQRTSCYHCCHLLILGVVPVMRWANERDVVEEPIDSSISPDWTLILLSKCFWLGTSSPVLIKWGQKVSDVYSSFPLFSAIANFVFEDFVRQRDQTVRFKGCQDDDDNR